MYFKHIFSFFLICFTIAAISVSSQTLPQGIDPASMKVSQYSDQQVLQVLQKIQTSGYSESDFYKMLAQQGMPLTEIEALKRRINILKSGGGRLNTPQNITKKDSTIYSRDSIKAVVPPALPKSNPIYGFDFFANPNLRLEPNSKMATPSNYVLGPDDEVIMNVNGLNETTITRRISPDGNIQIPSAGSVHLNGLTIDQARSQIRSKLLRIYPLIASGQTTVAIYLGNNRTIQVTVMGEVVKPGSYTISSLSTFSNALYLTGGPSIRGSLRNIQIIRANKVIRTVDFYPFIQKGLLDDNIRLEDQDVIYFEVYKKRVTIDGEVKRPGLYELLPAETLSDLIQYAGGFSDLAYKATAKIVQTGDKEKNLKDVPMDLFDNFVPKNADSIYFEKIRSSYTNRIVLQGAVYRPGNYELTPGLTLKQLIQNADGLREDASTANGYIKRLRPDLEKQMISFNLAAGDVPDILLMKEDSIMIFSRTDLKDELSITIDGFVRSPGTFTYRRGMKVSDAIALAGGFSNHAANHRVQISRIVPNRTDTMANQLQSSITLDVDSALRNNEQSALLEPLDYIYVPRLVNNHALGNVDITGEILFPGDYALQRRDETALELLKRAGGLSPYGSLANTKIYRNGIRMDIDLTGTKTRQNDKALILMPGDSIYVPREIPFVEVLGAVNNPQLLRYTGKSFKYYINSSGGIKENGRLKGAYVEYPNGINRPTGRLLFFRTYPRIEPGSKIFVPEKSPDMRIRLGFGEITAVTSALTALIGLIAILSK